MALNINSMFSMLRTAEARRGGWQKGDPDRWHAQCAHLVDNQLERDGVLATRHQMRAFLADVIVTGFQFVGSFEKGTQKVADLATQGEDHSSSASGDVVVQQQGQSSQQQLASAVIPEVSVGRHESIIVSDNVDDQLQHVASTETEVEADPEEKILIAYDILRYNTGVAREGFAERNAARDVPMTYPVEWEEHTVRFKQAEYIVSESFLRQREEVDPLYQSADYGPPPVYTQSGGFDSESFNSSDSRDEEYQQPPAADQQQDLYQVLGVSRDASQAEIKRSYYKLSRELHPDKNQDKSPAEQAELADKFKVVGNAYEILCGSTSRAAYDRDNPTAGIFEEEQAGSHHRFSAATAAA